MAVHNSPADPRTAVLAVWTDLSRVAADVGRAELLDPLAPARERLELGLFRLVVMGEIKKGKSSFVNALLGVDSLLPVDSDIATSTVYKVLYGPERRYKVFFRPDVDSGVRPPSLPISTEEVSAYGTEGGNPGNRKGVDFIGVELSHPMLKDGLVLVDTPGVGGLYKAHRDVTWGYAPNADAVFFVLDSVEAVISKDEVQFLKELIGKVTRRVYFVQTKTDSVEAGQWEAWRDRNLAVLSSELGLPADHIPYFPVSSRLKAVADRRASARHLADSGFPAVLNFLQHRLIREKRRHLAADLAGLLFGACRTLGADLTERKNILQAGQRADLDRVKREYEDARQTLDDWQRNRYPQELKGFQRGLADLKQRTRNQIQDQLDPTGPITAPLLDGLRNADFDPKALNDHVLAVQQHCLAQASEAIGDIYRSFNTGVVQLLGDTLARLGEGLRPTAPSDLVTPAEALAPDGAALVLKDRLDLHFDLFDDTRNAMYGGMAGSMMASIGIGVIGALFPPAAAVGGLAMLIGGALGGIKGVELAKVRKREEALTKLSGLLGDLMRKAQRQALVQFDEMTTRLDRTADDQFQTAIEARRREVQERLRQVEDARGQSRYEYKAKADQHAGWLGELARIEASLKALREPGSRRPG